jgi:hypothetical protein
MACRNWRKPVVHSSKEAGAHVGVHQSRLAWSHHVGLGSLMRTGLGMRTGFRRVMRADPIEDTVPLRGRGWE